MRKSLRILTTSTLVSIGLLVPMVVVIFAFVLFEDQGDVTTEGPAVIEFTPVVSQEAGERLATLKATWVPGDRVLAPALEGLVTSVKVRSQDELRSGEPVLAVDGITRIAWHSDEPFYRALSIDMRGDDVTELQLLLEDRGLMEGEPTGRVDRSTRLAIAELSRELGFQRDQNEFDPAWIIRLNQPMIMIEEVSVQVGNAAPGEGDVLLVGPTSIAAAELVDANGEGIAAVDGIEMTFGGATFTVGRDGSVRQADLASLADLLSPRDPESSAPNITTDTVTIRRSVAVESMRIPATSIVAGSDGQLCVWERTGIGPTGEPETVPLMVTLLGDTIQPGVAVIEALPVGIVIVANPSEALDAYECR